jgi:proteasome lid subunit RPN8/RPN11
VLALSSEDLARIRRHAGQAYPQECCGLLLGEPLGGDTVAQGARVTAVIAAANRHPEPRHGYDVDPRALLGGHRRAREEGREVVGYYHSHPDAPARLTGRDRAAALPFARYLIVAVAAGEPGEARCWRSHPRGELVEEPLQVTAP